MLIFLYQAQRTSLWWELLELDPVSWPSSSKVPPSVPSVVARLTRATNSATRPSPQANTSLPSNMVTSTLPAVHTNLRSLVRTLYIWTKANAFVITIFIKSLSLLSSIIPNNYHNCYILYTIILVCLLNFTLYIFFILYMDTYNLPWFICNFHYTFFFFFISLFKEGFMGSS